MSLRLDDQICFPLYAASRAVQQRYRPLLDRIGLTYTQYLVMMVLWEEDGLSMKELGGRLYLDSGTLTPLLRRLEDAGRVRRERSTKDARVVHVHLTAAGRTLRDDAQVVPGGLTACLPRPAEPIDVAALKVILDRLVHVLHESP